MERYLTSDLGAAIVGSGVGKGPGPEIMAASSFDATRVYSTDNEYVGDIKEIMIDVPHGSVAYVVLATGGFLGMGEMLHAIPWSALVMDTDAKCFRVGLSANRIKYGPGFHKDNWPSMVDEQWAIDVHRYYEREPYWLVQPAP